MGKKFKWVVEFSVDELWVADGFNLNDERALEMLSNDIGYAGINMELGAKVLNSPSKESISKAQGYDTVEAMEADDAARL